MGVVARVRLRLLRVSTRAALAASLALSVCAGDGLAKAPPPKAKNLSAISQYRESIPTAAGPTFPSEPGPSPEQEPAVRAPLPAPVERKVEAEGGSAAPALVEAATDPRYGAPQRKLPRIAPKQVVRTRPKPIPAAVLRAPGKLVTDGQSGRLLGLGVFLVFVTAGAAAAGYRRAT